jgi:hypothetical protein
MRDEIIDIIEGNVGSDINGEILYADDAADSILAALFNTDMREKIEDILWVNRQNNGIDVVYIADDIMAAFKGDTN